MPEDHPFNDKIDSKTSCSPESTAPYRTVMGFDFGLQKIGVAIGQIITKTATPLTIVKAREGKPHWESLDPLLKEWQPDALIVGNPLNMDGTESEISARAKKFARRLAARYTLPTQSMDERLSTREARERGENGQPGDIDAIAAAIILENWLSTQPQP